MKLYSHFNEIPKLYETIYCFKESSNNQLKFTVDLKDIIEFLKPQHNYFDAELENTDDIDNEEVEVISNIDQIHNIPKDFLIWKLIRQEDRVLILAKNNNNYEINFQEILDQEGSIEDHEGYRIHINGFKEQVLAFNNTNKIINFENFNQNKINLNRNNEIIFNPQISLESKTKKPIFVLNQDLSLPNDLIFNKNNLGSLLDVDRQLKTGHITEDITETRLNSLITQSLHELAKAESDHQDIYGKSLVYLLKGLIKYKRFDSKLNQDVEQYAPLFLIPVRSADASKITPSLEFEDYAILNFVFDKTIENQVSTILQEKRFNVEVLDQKIIELNNLLNRFTTINNSTITGFINKSYISPISGFSSVYLDKSWDAIENSDKVKRLINLEFGKEAQPLDGLRSMTPLDPSQEKAMKYALIPDNELTVIKGPPGTGKSQVIVSILSQIIKQNKKALFVSSKKVALEVITNKIIEFEIDLDNQNHQDTIQNNFRSLNDRILNLTSPKVRYKNYLSKAISDVRDKGDYFSNYSAYNNVLSSYSQLLHQKKIGNLKNTETTHNNNPIKIHGLLSHMARYKILNFEAAKIAIELTDSVDLNELKESLESISEAGFERFVLKNHVFTTLDRDYIQSILEILNPVNLHFNWNQKLSILDNARDIDDVIDHSIQLLSTLNTIGINSLFLTQNQGLDVKNFLNLLRENVDAVNQYETNEVLNLDQLDNELLQRIGEFGRDRDLSDLTHKFNLKIPVIEFYENQDILNQTILQINEKYSGIISVNTLVSEIKEKVAIASLATIIRSERSDFQDLCKSINDTLLILEQSLNPSFQVLDLEMLVNVRAVLDFFNISDIETFNILKDTPTESLIEFKDLLLILSKEGFNNFSVEKYEQIYQDSIKNQKYNNFTYFFSTFKNEINKNNIKLTLKSYKDIDFKHAPNLLLLQIFKGKSIDEISDIYSEILSKKQEFDYIYKQISHKININPASDLLCIFPKKIFPEENKELYEIKNCFSDLKLSDLIEFLGIVSNIDLVAIYAQNNTSNISIVLDFYKFSLGETTQSLPQNMPLSSLNDWILEYKKIVSQIQQIVDLNPYFYHPNDTVTSLIYKIVNIYYRIQLKKLTPNFKEEIDDILNTSENIFVSLNLSIFDNIQEFLTNILQLKNIVTSLNDFKFKKSGYSSVYEFIKYLQTIKESASEYQAYNTFLESQDVLINLLGDHNYNILKNEALVRNFNAQQFEQFVMNSILSTVKNEDIDWWTNNSHGLLNDYKNLAERQNHLEYLKARFYNFENNQLDNIYGNLNSPENKTKSTRNKLSNPDLFTQISTCFSVFLATPEDVSNFIPAQEDLFDYVIFDEASQVMIGEALPSIYRGKKIIVVGDPDQMPPSKFSFSFNGAIVADADEKSIVDLCLIGGSHDWKVFDLQVHYRSKHPDLFEVSRSAIYPKTKQLVMANNYKPLIRHQLEKKDDFETFVKYVNNNMNDDNKTYGIICMRIGDQVAIQRMINKKGVIVRALENMQGDEADEIFIFLNYTIGVGFIQAKNIWNEGGYKRLNVALTRSRKKMHIVHTTPLDEMERVANQKNDGGDNSKSANLVLNLVKLLNAHNPPDLNNENTLFTINTPAVDIEKIESPLERDFYYVFKDILSKLSHERFVLVPQVADGFFRIDFGVYDTLQNRYILGIELDGAMYHSDLEQIFNDSRRQKTLEAMGWKIYRIWSTDWFSSPEEEMIKLSNKINDLSTINPQNEELQAKAKPDLKNRIEESHDRAQFEITTVSAPKENHSYLDLEISENLFTENHRKYYKLNEITDFSYKILTLKIDNNEIPIKNNWNILIEICNYFYIVDKDRLINIISNIDRRATKFSKDKSDLKSPLELNCKFFIQTPILGENIIKDAIYICESFGFDDSKIQIALS